jgi:serine/threonine protein kinase
MPRGTLSQLEAIQVARVFLSADEELAAQKWAYLSSRVRDFLRRLLATEPENRMSAAQAVIHPWYKKPPREAKEMEEAYERVIRFWKPREAKDILEHIPAHDAESMESTGTKSRKRLPDASSSPYFSLNRHLTSRPPSKRLRVLEELNRSGLHFLSPENHQHKSGSRHDAHRPKPVRIRSTLGKDMFGKSIESKSESLACSDRGDRASASNMNVHSLSMRTLV